MKKKNNTIRKIIVCMVCVLIAVSVVGIAMYVIPKEDEHKEPLKVACVGDSLTFRRVEENETRENYPAYLGELLGEEYIVTNYGEPGACISPKGNNPYEKLRVYEHSQKANSDILVMMLGTNDVWDHNWQSEEEFRQEYVRILNTYLEGEKKPKVYLCTLPKMYQQDGTILETGCGERVELLSEVIRDIADEYNFSVIEMNLETEGHLEWYEADGLHFNDEGAKNIANIVYDHIK